MPLPRSAHASPRSGRFALVEDRREGPCEIRASSTPLTREQALEDCDAASGAPDVAPGTTSRTITVDEGWPQREPEELFYVNLSGAAGAVIQSGQGVGVVRNDDRQPRESHYDEGRDAMPRAFIPRAVWTPRA